MPFLITCKLLLLQWPLVIVFSFSFCTLLYDSLNDGCTWASINDTCMCRNKWCQLLHWCCVIVKGFSILISTVNTDITRHVFRHMSVVVLKHIWVWTIVFLGNRQLKRKNNLNVFLFMIIILQKFTKINNIFKKCKKWIIWNEDNV